MASVGVPRTDVEVRVVDEQDRSLPVGEIGEICVRGDVVMSGYWDDPDATAQTLRGGWLHTDVPVPKTLDDLRRLKEEIMPKVLAG